MSSGRKSRGGLPQIALLVLVVSACSTAGSAWMAEPLPGAESSFPEVSAEQRIQRQKPRPSVESRTLGEPETPKSRTLSGQKPTKKLVGKVLGKFRNTYYDFPSEGDYQGEPLELMNASCQTIKQVPRGFYEAVCVQGSGTLMTGQTVSFAKRNCECAAVCPRTNQKICFDTLSAREFPWGRGATGKPITPLLTVAVDVNLIPLGTPVYIPEFDGAPRDAAKTALHDGCFIAQDRGLKIKGKHIDVFTGHRSVTELWNRLVPSNQGVTVVLENPRCARAQTSASLK